VSVVSPSEVPAGLGPVLAAVVSGVIGGVFGAAMFAVETVWDSPAAKWVLGCAGLLVAVGIIWRQGIRPVTKMALQFGEHWPSLVRMAQQFDPDGNETGKCLSDRLDGIDTAIADLGSRVQEVDAALKTLATTVVEQGDLRDVIRESRGERGESRGTRTR